MRIKIFSDTSYPRVEEVVNDWLSENEPTIRDDFDVEVRVDTAHTSVIYTVIILYDEV